LPISLPAGLPARNLLQAESLEVLEEGALSAWGRRPLRVCLVNLMPNKPAAEMQFARLLAGTPIPVELSLALPDGYHPKSTAPAHLAFYKPWSALRHEAIDAIIVTGAPVEELAFEEVTYWPGLCAILDWARMHPVSSLFICWSAQAALYRYLGVVKHRLAKKLFGVHDQRVTDSRSTLLTGFSETFPVPVSRHTEVREAELPAGAGLSVLACSAASGLCLAEDARNRAVYMFNHLEYDAGTLRDEFDRDRQAGRLIAIPENYFPGDNPERQPVNTWRAHGQLLIANWLADIGRRARPRIADEPQIQWTLAAPRSTDETPADYADYLVSANGSSMDVLSTCLRRLAELRLAPLAVKVHRQANSSLLIEIRTVASLNRTGESIAQRLCSVSSVASVAYRTANAAGWCVARGANKGGTPQAANSPGWSLPAAS
jgi:homoserine O-succinyltransferase/O-acetyltransferase